MGTNFYAVDDGDACPTCGAGTEELHIGKRSAGWNFMLHIIPEKGLLEPEDWYAYWEANNIVIYDEYGRVIPYDDMLHIINNWHEGEHTKHEGDFS